MTDPETTKHTVTTNEKFVDDLCDIYPAANSVAQALLMAAQDGVKYKEAIEGDLEGYVRSLVRCELDDSDVRSGLRADD